MMKMESLNWVPIAGLTIMMGCATERLGTAGTIWALDSTPLNRTAAELSNSTAEHLAWAKAYRSRISEVRAPRTVNNTLEPANDMLMHLDAAASECQLFRQVHPDAAVRDVARTGEQQIAAFATELSLDRDLYEAIKSMDLSDADAGTRWLVEKRLRDFRRAGVDKSEEDRKRISALNDDIVKIGQQFSKNITDDENRREIVLDSIADLNGLPDDWINKHRPGSDGKIHVSVRSPDYVPYITYAQSSEGRRRLYTESRNRGFPQNIVVLSDLLAKRNELAQLLGYAHWADYVTEDKMIGTAANAAAFIEKIAAASAGPAKRDYDQLLAWKRQDTPAASRVEDWEKSYYEQLVQRETYAFDAQAVRPYFNFPDVQNGLFDLTQKLLGLRYKQVNGLNLWHESVTAWDVFEGNRHVGRFYLDLHPRENKYGHAAQFDYRTGIAGKRLPQATLVCNFPNPADSVDGTALMEHDDVVTFFHEFGHLLHGLLAGHQKWIGNSGISTEWDFVEAPSQMLEEWCYDYDSLKLFARHHQTGETIPPELVEKLRRASDFGKGLQAAHQMFYAAVSLNYYNRSPKGLDTTRLMIELQDKYSPFDYVPETHFQCSFGHLDGYSAIYYTYMWSKVIAKDMFSKFEQDGILNAKTARMYRDTVLAPGGSKKAAELVKDFMGRPYSFDAFEAWLNKS